MGTEKINTWTNIEKTEKNIFSEQIKNLKYAVILTLWMSPTLVSAQNTIPTDSSKVKTEIVQQWEDPVKDLMKKYHVDTLIDVEVMDLKDMIAMLKDIYTITAGNNQLESVFKELTQKLERCIKWETKDFDFTSLKSTWISNKESDEEKKKLDEEEKRLKNENQALGKTEIVKKDENQAKKKEIQDLKADWERAKQVIAILEWWKKQ